MGYAGHSLFHNDVPTPNLEYPENICLSSPKLRLSFAVLHEMGRLPVAKAKAHDKYNGAFDRLRSLVTPKGVPLQGAEVVLGPMKGVRDPQGPPPGNLTSSGSVVLWGSFREHTPFVSPSLWEISLWANAGLGLPQPVFAFIEYTLIQLSIRVLLGIRIDVEISSKPDEVCPCGLLIHTMRWESEVCEVQSKRRD
ncbi:hypothetical protein E5288_WYG003452 [Bos mutus]|uniref:Uncharacterized protein n=1 Tax=Bos mutus TaxID=72004 RepID=A0A6B0S2J9_9CETA|nr:hypothetical protein [Bos mutus]